MTPVEGIVKGAECPECGEELLFEGTFFVGQEVECSCGLAVEIRTVEAVYTVTLQPLSKRSRCVECSKMKNDPDDFYDGLRCKECCERADAQTGEQ